MNTKKLILKIMMPLEFGRDYTAITDTERSKTITFTSNGDVLEDEEVPPFLIPYVINFRRGMGFDTIFKLNCDWDTIMKTLKENREEYQILPDDLFD